MLGRKKIRNKKEEGRKAEMEKIAQAVIDAGFSLRYLQADFNMSSSIQQTGQCFKFNGDYYSMMVGTEAPATGRIKLKFIGKEFLSKSELKKTDQFQFGNCGSADGRVYHVILQ